MDEIVKAALAKWPNVPDCRGWLALDRRGRWRMRDWAAQQRAAPGEIIQHTGLIAFIARNYACTEQGEWFFQNGPQRVYVSLEATPFIFFFDPHTCQFNNHLQQTVKQVYAALLDEQGHVYLHTDSGFGLLCDRDLPAVLATVMQPTGADKSLILSLPNIAPIAIEPVLAQTLPERFAYRT